MNLTSIDDKISLQQMQKLGLWRRSLGHRRRKLEQLERSVKQMFLDLAEEEKDWIAEEAKWASKRASMDTATIDGSGAFERAAIEAGTTHGEVG